MLVRHLLERLLRRVMWRVLRLLVMLLWRIGRLLMRLIMLRNRPARALQDDLVEPLADRHSGLARGFPCSVADFRPHTFHVPRDALPHALTQTIPARTDP
jgi:hypothetical protein